MKNSVYIGIMIVMVLLSCSRNDEDHSRDEAEGIQEDIGAKPLEPRNLPKQFQGDFQVRSRSFGSFDELATFAEKELGAEIIYQNGRIAGITGHVYTGDIEFSDEKGQRFQQQDFVAAFLGGREGVMKIDDQDIRMFADTPKTDGLAAASPTVVCDEDGEDCISGESWVNHSYSFIGYGYHSAGSKTIQTQGGKGTVYYNCCGSGGTMITRNGVRQCRYRNPGAWEFDKELKEWVPTASGEPLYSYGDLEQCFYQYYQNTLTTRSRFLIRDGIVICPNCDKTANNLEELTASEYLISVPGFDFGPYYLDKVYAVCGYHESSRGGSGTSSSPGDEEYCEGLW